MDQCKHCIVRGNLDKCLETNCSYHELWMVKEVKRELENQLSLIGSQLEWIEAVLDDQEVSDFAMSFPVIRRVWELKQNETQIEDPAETARKSAEASLTKWKAEQEVE